MDDELTSPDSPTTSPVLLALHPDKLPNPLPACAACPGRNLARIGAGPALLLPRDASGVMDERGAAAHPGLRRPGNRRPGAGGQESWSNVVKRNRGSKKEVRGEWIGGTLGGPDASPRDIAREAAPFRRARPDIAAPVLGISLSLHPTDGSKSEEQWRAMVSRFLELIDFPKHGAWTCERHQDTDHEHVHITLLRSLGDGRIWNDSHCVIRAHKAAEQIEKEFGLHWHSREKNKDQKVHRDEEILAERMEKRGKKMSKQAIREAIDAAVEKLGSKYTIEQLRSELAAQGVSVDPYSPAKAKGEIKGLRFEHGGIWVQAGQLGSGYKADDLFGRGLHKFVDEGASKQMADETPKSAQKQAAKGRDEQKNRGDAHNGAMASIVAGLADMSANGAILAAKAIAALINALMRLIELIAGAKEGSLARIDTSNLQLKPARMLAPGEPGAEQQKKAMDMAAPALERAAEAVEARDAQAMADLPIGKKTAGQVLPAEVAAVRKSLAEGGGGGSAGSTERHAAAPHATALDDTEVIDGRTRGQARELMRDVAIRWLLDRQEYLQAHAGVGSPELRSIESELATLNCGEADRKKYQEWLASTPMTDETHDEYILRREREYLDDLHAYIAMYDDADKRREELERAERRIAEIEAIQAAKESSSHHERERR